MSPLEWFKSYWSGREMNTSELDNDPLVDMLKADKYPSPIDIRRHRGELTVKPFILAEASYFLGSYLGYATRRTNESAIVHFANTEIRPVYWNLGFSNGTEDRIILIYMHDLGEDKSNDTIAGNYAIVRVPAEVFGQQYHGPLSALTNVRATIHKQLEDRIKYDLSDHPTQADIIRFLHDLRARLGSLGSLNDQSLAYGDLAKSIDLYNRKISTFVWNDQDQEEVREFLSEVNGHINDLKGRLIQQETIATLTERYFSDFENYVNDTDSLVRAPNCILLQGESVLMHNLDHSQYSDKNGSYLEDLLSYAIERSNSKNLLGNIAILTKIQEDTDNVRKEGQKTAYRSHMTYHKAISVAEISERFLTHVRPIQKPEEYRDIELALRFLKEQLLVRVIKDYSQVSLEIDQDYRNYRNRWYPLQFKVIKDYVGPDIEGKVVEDLKQTNEKLYDGYIELTEIVRQLEKSIPRDDRNKPARSWRSLFF